MSPKARRQIDQDTAGKNDTKQATAFQGIAPPEQAYTFTLCHSRLHATRYRWSKTARSTGTQINNNMSRNCRPPPRKHPPNATSATLHCSRVNASDDLIANGRKLAALERLTDDMCFISGRQLRRFRGAKRRQCLIPSSTRELPKRGESSYGKNCRRYERMRSLRCPREMGKKKASRRAGMPHKRTGTLGNVPPQATFAE